MTDCFVPQLTFSFYRKPICANFRGGEMSSDSGLLLLRRFDERHQLTRGLAQDVDEQRRAQDIDHPLLALLRQRLYAICAGYEDANDAQHLRHDPILKLISERELDETLASQPTLSRLENTVTPRSLARLNHRLLDWFVRLCGQQVRQHGEILLDVDSTPDPTHGQQQLSLFNGHYGKRIYHPLLIFERHSGAATVSATTAWCRVCVVCCVVCGKPFPASPSACALMPVSPSLPFTICWRSTGSATRFAWSKEIPCATTPPPPSPRPQATTRAPSRHSGSSPPLPTRWAPGPIPAAWWPKPNTMPSTTTSSSSSAARTTQPRPFSSSTTDAASAKTASPNSRTASTPTASVARASWPMPFVCCCTAWPTIWSISSATTCPPDSAARRSMVYASACLRSAPACSKPLAASGCIWLPVGPDRTTSARRRRPADSPASASDHRASRRGWGGAMSNPPFLPQSRTNYARSLPRSARFFIFRACFPPTFRDLPPLLQPP